MVKNTPSEIKTLDEPWMQDVERCLANRLKGRALKIMDAVIGNDVPLFRSDPAILRQRRMAWLQRISLLRQMGRFAEALAWTCLECEINPDNVAAQALKRELKENANLSARISDGGGRTMGPIHMDRWQGVVGMREIKETLERDVILPLQEPELYELYKLSLPNGILFYGPPGCGKTFIARKLAEVIQFNFMEIKPSDLASIYVHGGQEKIGGVFAEARKNAPTLLFLDELDALIPNREWSSVGHHYAAEVNEFLVQINSCWSSKVLVVGATNLLNKIDPAVRRPGRLDKSIFIGPPDFEARLGLLKAYMKDRPQESINWAQMAEASALYTPAELKLIVDEAARKALMQRRQITGRDILDALNENPPNVRVQDILNAREAATLDA